jgi:hypothetical protein
MLQHVEFLMLRNIAWYIPVNILVVHSFIFQNASSNPPGLFLSGMSKEFSNKIEVV